MCISASGDVDLWVRLYPTESNKVSVDFSTVQLDRNLQRRGIFTYIFNHLKSLEVVGVLEISSVCTSCMRSWCIGKGLKTVDGFDYFA